MAKNKIFRMIKLKRSKYKTTLIKKAKEELAQEEAQKRLHEKYPEVSENKEIIETSHYFKVIISGIIFYTLIAIFAGLAICGLGALVFEGPRKELFSIFRITIEYLSN